jgi:hypothetical protein
MWGGGWCPKLCFYWRKFSLLGCCGVYAAPLRGHLISVAAPSRCVLRVVADCIEANCTAEMSIWKWEVSS